jgi:hypothetical protein
MEEEAAGDGVVLRSLADLDGLDGLGQLKGGWDGRLFWGKAVGVRHAGKHGVRGRLWDGIMLGGGIMRGRKGGRKGGKEEGGGIRYQMWEVELHGGLVRCTANEGRNSLSALVRDGQSGLAREPCETHTA